MTTAPYQYRHYTIDKRTGGKRDIYHPTPNLKAVQRWLVYNCFSRLPVHSSVHSYAAGKNIRTHAEVHINSSYLLRFDFVDFFPSLNQAWVRQFIRTSVADGYLSFEADLMNLVPRLVCRHSKADGSLALSIGAPSSPALSNAMLYRLDATLHEMAEKHAARYTRYADDVYFSAERPNALGAVENEFRAIIQELAPQLRVNEAKTERRSRKTRRVVTGLVLTPNRQISIGRERKRSIRTRVFLFTQGRLSGEDTQSLAGLLAFASDIEPKFVMSLRAKFGHAAIDELISHTFSRLE